jgi:hypothetical protein
MTTVRAHHYPQPRPSADVLAETAAGYCEHDGVPARCPMCRTAAHRADTSRDQETTPPVAAHAGSDDHEDEPAGQQPADLQLATPSAAEDDEDPRATPWWDR